MLEKMDAFFDNGLSNYDEHTPLTAEREIVFMDAAVLGLDVPKPLVCSKPEKGTETFTGCICLKFGNCIFARLLYNGIMRRNCVLWLYSPEHSDNGFLTVFV